ncbi:hypothetical protein CRUP_038188 [Coryphaenoides rupestris]|nr:hypothetical protein CRUP_038188 [Coryphaenoides rupestris]
MMRITSLTRTCSCTKPERYGTLAPVLRIRPCSPPATTKRVTARWCPAPLCGVCPATGTRATATSRPTTPPTIPRRWKLLCHPLTTAPHGNVACVLWEPMGDGKRAISLADNHALLWDLQESSTQATISSTATLEGKGQLRFTVGKWSPHHNCSQLATANDTAIRGWDLRTMSQIYCIENAHGQLVRDLDFNPNRQYYLASCGDDCKVRFWDVRNVQEPVKSLEDHSHWVWSVRYNHSHDQLVLTASSDSRLILSNMVSISSEPFGQLVDDEELSDGEDAQPADKLKEAPDRTAWCRTYEEHEDTVRGRVVPSADPGSFASLSLRRAGCGYDAYATLNDDHKR